MDDRWFFLHLWMFLSFSMAARCRPTLKGKVHKTNIIHRPIESVIPKPFHERSKKHNVFTLAAPPSTAALLPSVDNMVLMPNGVPAALGEAVHHMFHQHPLNIPYIPGPLHGGIYYGGLHHPSAVSWHPYDYGGLHHPPAVPWHHYGGLYSHHGFDDPYMYHGPALYPVDFPAGFPSYVLDHSQSVRGDNSPGTVFLGARNTLPHPSMPAVVHYPHPQYARLNGNGQLVVASSLPVYLNTAAADVSRRGISKRSRIMRNPTWNV